AKILNVPFRSVKSVEELKYAMKDFHHMDLVLIDTTGRSQKAAESLREMQDILKTVPGLQTHLVLSATTRDQELYEMGKRFSLFKTQSIIFSKLDEALSFGCLY